MTALIWMLAWLSHVLPAMSELPQPVNLTLHSHHFIHVLKWEPGPGTPTGVYYRVSVITETGTYWEAVAGCEHVQHPLVCNLTEAFSDPREDYFTEIKALLEAQDSPSVTYQSFKPIRDTQLDLPLLTVTTCGQDLCVDLQPPMEHLRETYDSLHYKLRTKSNNTDKAQHFNIKSLRRQILKDLAPGRRYCVSVGFSDRSTESNYSQPVCALTPGHYTADPLIAALVSGCVMLVVLSCVLIGAFLVSTGYICLKKRPLPSTLTSVHHIDAAPLSSDSASISSFLNLKSTVPSSGEKRRSQTSDDSDGESETESSGRSRGGGYKLCLGTNLLSSSSSSSSLSAPELPPSFSSKQASDRPEPRPEPVIPTETHSNAGLMSKHTASHSDSVALSDQRSDPRPADTIQTNEEEEKVVGDGGMQDVNLLTLIFSRCGEDEDEDDVDVEKSHFEMTEEEPNSSSASEVYNTTPTLLSQSRDTTDVAIGTVSCSDDEEDEEEHSGYMGRPCADVLRNYL